MTRRICAFQCDGKYYISQEFNGDMHEQSLFHIRPSLTCDWVDVIGTFDGCQTLEDFKAAVHSMENAYGYEHEALEIAEKLPDNQEQVWLLVDGSLQLHTIYGRLVKSKDEIVKALELCNHKSGSRCSTCPYKNNVDCKPDLLNDAIALINRLSQKRGV